MGKGARIVDDVGDHTTCTPYLPVISLSTLFDAYTIYIMFIYNDVEH
jgi:hypothetical protein